MIENWKAIPGWEGLYEASNLGRIRRIAPARGTNSGTVLSARPHPDGYVRVTLRGFACRLSTKAHRLVALTWLGPSSPDKRIVNHKNGIKHDNRVSNLEWTDLSGNLRHAFANGLQPSRAGECNANARLTARNVRRIRELYRAGQTLSQLAECYAITKTQVSWIVNFKCWKQAGGPRPPETPRQRRVGDPGPVGVLNGQAKLTEEEVLEIRRLRALERAQRPDQSVVASRFGIARSLVSLIENRKIWTHV